MSKKHQSYKNKVNPFDIKQVFFWFVVYGILIGLFNFFTDKYGWLEKTVPHYFILGLLMVVGGRFIYSAVKQKTFRTRRILPWAAIYAILLFIISSILEEITSLTNTWGILAITTIVFTFSAIFFRRANMKSGSKKRRRNKFLRAPSQILTGIALLVFGILSWRLSYKVFVEWIGWPEGMAWSWLIGLILMIAGFLTVLAWWRNNVLQHRVGIKFGKW
jgi:hypothetical protein